MSGPRLREVEGKYTFEFRCDPWDEAAPVTHRVLVWRAFEAILNDEPGFTVEKKGARLTVTVPIACWMPTAWPLNAATRNRRSGRVRERRHAVRDVEGEPRISAEALGKMSRYRNPRRLRHFARQKLAVVGTARPRVGGRAPLFHRARRCPDRQRTAVQQVASPVPRDQAPGFRRRRDDRAPREPRLSNLTHRPEAAPAGTGIPNCGTLGVNTWTF
jgi:hypothetical protein